MADQLVLETESRDCSKVRGTFGLHIESVWLNSLHHSLFFAFKISFCSRKIAFAIRS